MGAPLDVFWAGFLYNSCLPLELSLDVCSQGCGYCFAVLRDPKRKVDAGRVERLIATYTSRDSYAAWLLRERHGIVISNGTDPFSCNNADKSLRIIEMLLQAEIPFSLQTKGGDGAYAALDLLDRYGQRIVWYISVTTLDESTAKKFERNAPSPQERLKLIEAAIQRGHKVCVGINPCVPQWLPEPKELTDKLAHLGVHGAWIQPLHLSKSQLMKIKPMDLVAYGAENKEQARFWQRMRFRKKYFNPPPLLAQALKPRSHPRVVAHTLLTKYWARQSGLEVYDNQQAEVTDYFQPYKDLYPQRYPLMQDWVNECHATKSAGDPIYWEEFRDFFLPHLPKGTRGLKEHLTAMVARQRFYGLNIPQHMNYEQLLHWIWCYRQTLYCPANVRCFGWAGAWERQPTGKMAWTRLLVGNSDDPFLVFCPEGTEEAFVQWE